MATTSTSTTGSTLLQPLSDAVQLPIDQVNFVVCQLFALLAAVWFRTYLHSSKTSSFIRHVVATLLGLYLAVFCFGWYALHFLVQSGVSYCIMTIIGMEHMHNPMMIMTQKITSLAYEIHDGMFRKDEDLTPPQRDLAVRRMPSLLEYLSYNCNFMGILAGPLCSYKDYVTFIEGRSHHVARPGEDGREAPPCGGAEPSPTAAVVQKLVVCGLSLLVHLTISNALPVEYNIDAHFQATASWPTKVLYLYVSLLAARPKYYFAWTLADAINNAAGFGFRGYDRHGEARWDLISNLRIQQIEGSTSFKMFLDNWNIQTALWLKRVCYERTTWNPTVQTFVLSAIWHGVYPGYYLTFLTGVLMTLAARAMRNNFRHYFLKSPQRKLLYDVVTWAATQVAVSYTVVPFVLLSVKPSFAFYSSWSYCLHIAGLLVLLFLPVKKTQRGQDPHEHRRLSRSKKFDENSWGQNSFPTTTNNVCNQGPAQAARHPSGAE
ncbi:lysophospholipid acyltransferase 2 isoform X2 [Myotis myotis]|uniref:Membrane bound O-acyltransferase domain containing 2 n=1 Tax=Myotis myotis TaxID=51298 RepID=A0A7J7U5S9_MYOMY|nr:lysophospholipid acyltransferase 2 isoform X2 [Myotis myotis]KAF6308172.1 membrane bound O-acyltransferase domain containing 2 [Myotis myotis]